MVEIYVGLVLCWLGLLDTGLMGILSVEEKG